MLLLQAFINGEWPKRPEQQQGSFPNEYYKFYQCMQLFAWPPVPLVRSASTSVLEQLLCAA